MAPDTFQDDARELHRLLAPTRPHLARPGGTLDERARVDLQHILDTPGASDARSSSRRTVLGLAAAACLAAATATAVDVLAPRGLAGMVGLRPATAQAATPPLLTYAPLPGTAADRLQAIAARTAALPDDVGSGPVAHLETRSWDLWTRVDGERVTSAVVEQRGESWTLADGSGLGRTSQVRDGEVVAESEDRWAPQERSWMWPLGSLSSDPATLAGQLELGHPTSIGPVERLVAIRDAVGEQPLGPAQRAAVLDYLAATPGLQLDGSVRDRAGRDGVSVGLDSDHSGLPTRYSLVIDPADGRVLASEEVLTTTAGKLDVPVPSVIGYAVYLDAGFVRGLPA